MINYKSKVEKIVSESEDIITALEAIGPMYGIPSTNMLEDATIQSIKVVDDHIIAPSGVKPTTKPIMCAIGAVLDHISQRVDEKVNQFQADNIQKGKLEEHIRRDANPAKGTVIGRYEDSNGDEILAYDSGLVDMANTKEAQQKVAELRSQGVLPEYKPTPITASKVPYFTADDDISVEEPKSEIFDDSDKICLSEKIHESAQIIDWIAHYHDTTHLGYDMLQEQGFDFVKPVDSVVLESAKKSKEVKLADIKHMKFDNSHILKAVKLFNAARAEQPEVGRGDFDRRKFINSPNYQKAIKELEAQFDCHITLKWLQNDELYDNAYTEIYDRNYMVYNDITVSKSKGFQLHGLPIAIFVWNDMIDSNMTKKTDQGLFGQFMCSILCHEIFHNIAAALRYANTTFNFTISTAMSLATSTSNAKNRRIIFEKFVKTLSGQGLKLNGIQKKKLVRDLCYISAIAHNKKQLEKIKGKLDTVGESGAANHEIDEYIKLLEKYDKMYTKMKKNHEFAKKHPIAYGILYTVGMLLTFTIVGAIVGIPICLLTADILGKDYDDYMKSVNKEEYYCDLFAASYQLPVAFTLGLNNREYASNQISKDRLQKLTTLERNINEFMQGTYPTLPERNYAGVKVAKTLLDSKTKLDPAIKEYCEWIVANHSNILDTDISTKYSTVTFNPEEANDLDEHIQNLIDNNDIAITEYAN